MKIKQMLNDNILVKTIKNENKTSSGIIMGESVKNYNVVEVVNKPESFKAVDEGDVLYISKHAGMEIIIEDCKYLIIKTNDIILKM